MPEPESDKFRTSPGLSLGLKKPDYPIREFVYTTDDEPYQFREPNVAYNDGSKPFELPDGLQSDGTQPRHWGDVAIRLEDNSADIRHNAPGAALPSESEKANLAKFRGEAASRIPDLERRRKFIAEQGNLESKGKTDRLSHNRLETDAALE